MDQYNSLRIERLRDAAVEPVISYEEFYFHFYRRHSENESLGSREARYADAYRYAFERVTPIIDEGELIVGKCRTRLNETESAEWLTLKENVAAKMTLAAGQDSHMAIDYELLLREGVEGVRGRIEAKLAQEDDPKKRGFYELCAACLEATTVYARRYAELAERLAAECADEIAYHIDLLLAA